LQQIRDFEDGIKKAHHLISNKKREKQEDDRRLALNLKEIKLQKQYNNANAAMIEAKQWEGLEHGKERMIRDAQNNRLIN